MERLYIRAEDFFQKTAGCRKLRSEEELVLAARMSKGDAEAREALIRGYLPHVAAAIRRMPHEYQTLELVMRCITALEKAVDRFDFTQSGERFSHRLSWVLRQTTTAYMADKRT